MLSEKRLAADNIEYSYKEFIEYYGNANGERLWGAAKMLEANAPQIVATEHNAPIAADGPRNAVAGHDRDSTTAASSPPKPADLQASPQPAATKHSFASQGTATELRQLDNYIYSYEIMEAWFNDEAPQMWAKAIPMVMRHLPAPQEQIHATEQNLVKAKAWTSTEPGPANLQSSLQTDATEHIVSLPVVLSGTEVNAERALEEKIKPPRSLHKIARDTLNTIITCGVDSNINRNLDGWFEWRRYIACHKRAHDIIGPGVTHACAEYISQTNDPNRGNQERLDFVIYRSDGSTCRLHPGKTASKDAQLIYTNATIPATY